MLLSRLNQQVEPAGCNASRWGSNADSLRFKAYLGIHTTIIFASYKK